jgi:hypothetical protein
MALTTSRTADPEVRAVRRVLDKTQTPHARLT